MTAALIGLIGAALGALTAVIGSSLAERRQARRENARWRRDQQSAAYNGAFHALTRAASHRHKIPTSGELDQPTQRQWFSDLVEAQYQLRVLISHYHCPGAGETLPIAAERLNTSLAYLSQGELTKSAALTDEVAELLTQCARLDMRSGATNPISPPAGDDGPSDRPGAGF